MRRWLPILISASLCLAATPVFSQESDDEPMIGDDIVEASGPSSSAQSLTQPAQLAPSQAIIQEKRKPKGILDEDPDTVREVLDFPMFWKINAGIVVTIAEATKACEDLIIDEFAGYRWTLPNDEQMMDLVVRLGKSVATLEAGKYLTSTTFRYFDEERPTAIKLPGGKSLSFKPDDKGVFVCVTPMDPPAARPSGPVTKDLDPSEGRQQMPQKQTAAPAFSRPPPDIEDATILNDEPPAGPSGNVSPQDSDDFSSSAPVPPPQPEEVDSSADIEEAGPADK